MPLIAGQVLQNRYRIVALLGRGGMGAVYRAWDLRLDKTVALKEMAPQPGLDAATLAQLRSQFRHEAVTLGTLAHPNLVPVTDYFEELGNDYLVMAFVEGESLARLIERSGALPEGQVMGWALQLLNALDYCHRKGAIHRDIKPQNVIITPESGAVLVDFGLVKLWDPADPVTRTGLRGAGTLEYAPPEQWGAPDQHADPRSDLYALGATLYHALTGQAPPTVTARIANPATLIPIRQYNPLIGTGTELALERAMALQPEKRFQSALEMHAALSGPSRLRPAKGGTAVAPPPGTRALTSRLPFSKSTMTLAVVLLCVMVVGGAAGGIYWWTKHGPPGRGQDQLAAMGTAPVETATVPVLTGTMKPTTAPLATATPTASAAGAATAVPTASATATAAASATATATLSPSPTASETPTPIPTPTPTDTPTVTPRPTFVVEAAAAYRDEAALRDTFQVNDPNGTPRCSLGLESGGQVMAFSYVIQQPSPSDYCGFERWRSDPQNWSGYAWLCADVTKDGEAGDLVVQFGEPSGEVWKNRTAWSQVTQGRYCLPLTTAAFDPAEWAPRDNGRIDLGAITYYGIYVNGQPGASGVVRASRIWLEGP